MHEGDSDENEPEDRCDAVGRSNIGMHHEFLENRPKRGHKRYRRTFVYTQILI